jgi:hypothetical protein
MTMSYKSNKAIKLGNYVLLGFLLVLAFCFKTLIDYQYTALAADKVGLLYMVNLRSYLIYAFIGLLGAVSMWFAFRYEDDTRRNIGIVLYLFLAIIIVLSVFNRHSDSSEFYENPDIRETEVQRLVLIHLASWIPFAERKEVISEVLFDSPESIQEQWDALGYKKQLDGLINLRQKDVVPFDIGSRWRTKVIADKVTISTEDFLDNALYGKNQGLVEDMTIVMTVDARLNIIIANLGLLAIIATGLGIAFTMIFEPFKYFVFIQMLALLPATLIYLPVL